MTAVNFGSAPFDPNPLDRDGRAMAGTLNRRAEMWSASRDWLARSGWRGDPRHGCAAGRRLRAGYRYDMNQRLGAGGQEAMRACVACCGARTNGTPWR